MIKNPKAFTVCVFVACVIILGLCAFGIVSILTSVGAGLPI